LKGAGRDTAEILLEEALTIYYKNCLKMASVQGWTLIVTVRASIHMWSLTVTVKAAIQHSALIFTVKAGIQVCAV